MTRDPRGQAEALALEISEACGEPEIDRHYVCDVVVERAGAHFRIVAGAEDPCPAMPIPGRCACGHPLSVSFRGRFCRRCDR